MSDIHVSNTNKYYIEVLANAM